MIFFSDIGPNLANSIPDSLLELDVQPPVEGPYFEVSHSDVRYVKELLKKVLVTKARNLSLLNICSKKVIVPCLLITSLCA